MSRIYLILFILGGIHFFAAGQVTLQKTFGGSSVEGAYSSCPIADGGSYMAGYVEGSLTKNALVMRLDSLGELRWSRSYDSGDDDVLASINKTSDGGFIACGRIGTGIGDDDVLLMRCDSAGNILWTKRFGSSGDDFGNVCVNPDGSFLVVRNNHAAANSLFLHRVDDNGNLTWSKTVSFPWDIQPGGFDITSNGSILICANNVFTYEVLLIKLSASGSLSWAKKYGPPASPLIIFQTTVISNVVVCFQDG
jgi:hypothetical protein